ncbi:MAG: nitrilase-related carbon-nitrogen hydrolase [Candidatus Thorarchaeota archaeon]
MVRITQIKLIKEAEAEESNYNWQKAASLYEQIANAFLDEKSLEKASIYYKKLGYAYEKASHTVDTSEDFKNMSNLAHKAYKNALNLFNQIEKIPEDLECEAEIFKIKGLFANSKVEGKDCFKKSYELFVKSSEIYRNDNDQENLARTLSCATESLYQLVYCCTEQEEMENYIQKGLQISHEAWIIAKKVINYDILADSLYALGRLIFLYCFIIPFKEGDEGKKLFNSNISLGDISLKLIQESNDPNLIAKIKFFTGAAYGGFAIQFVEDAIKQKEYGDKAIILLETGIKNVKNIKSKRDIINGIFWLNYTATSLRRFNYAQKRIWKDMHTLLEMGELYEGLLTEPYFLRTIFPAFYYTNLSQRSFIKPDQQKKYAELAIQYAKESLENFSFLPMITWSYQALTWSYSKLAYLTNVQDEQNQYIDKMISYAKKAENVSKNFRGGFSVAAGYSSLFKAYKTQADLAKKAPKKIETLKLAIEAHKNYLGNEVESPTGTIAAQIRLGLLYQELGILTQQTETFERAREAFLLVEQESKKRKFFYYTATAYEYLAHIEDRIGNYSESANFYEKARDIYQDLLDSVEYKPLRKIIIEKIEYTKAWNLVEKAKNFHKNEEHLMAKESYQKASKIQKNLPKFNFEAHYYEAWALLEEAEHLSKQEKPLETITKYKESQNAFENTIKILVKNSKSSNLIEVKERIEKLEIVARLRMNYCTAKINLEEGRILGKQGEHIKAAEQFGKAASQFRNVCSRYKIEKEKKDLEAIYYLCRAWENMELAENYLEPERYAEAADLFLKASQIFHDNKMKLLASGNSAFCHALKLGCKFDESYDSETKVKLYPNIKAMLRGAATSYEKGGFKNGSDWALATSTYFDGVWHIIKADEEMDIKEKENLLKLGKEILRSTAELFGKAGYEDKQNEVLNRIELIEKEEKILLSALNSIKKPEISGSTTGIIAPACPIEISQSPKLSEVHQITENILKKYVEEKIERKNYEIIYTDFLKHDLKTQKSQFRIGIAQIGLSESGDIITEFFEKESSGLLRLKKEKVNTVRNKIKEMVKNASNNKINVLIFPEMTIDLNYREFKEEISNLAKEYCMYIIPGSYHDQETKQNICMVISPEKILWKQEKHIPAIIQFKEKKFKEAIETTSKPRKILVCNTEYGRISIAICRDFLDMDLRVELKNFEPPVDIIINPAFTPVTADFKATHFDARRSIYAYCFFANVAEFGDSLIYTPEKDRTERNIPAKQEGLIFKDVDLFKLRTERKRWDRKKGKELQFIQSTR